jgi:UDP-N-acetylglucosamine 2-epimerase (non-hydrolysing)
MKPLVRILSVVGARPNFMKIAPFVAAINRHNHAVETGAVAPPAVVHHLVHTGQHYDNRMSTAFFEALAIPRPDVDLGIGSGSHAEQVGHTMIAFERVVHAWKPDWIVVVGDVNATCACSITAKKEHVRLAHIEAGLRSRDMDMPEEINRLVTDRLSDLLLTPDRLSNENLRKEGVPADRIAMVGNIMIDTLEAHRAAAGKLDLTTILRDNALEPFSESKASAFSFPNLSFSLLTMHRPSNVDSQAILEPILHFLLNEVCPQIPLIWPIHPRAQKQLQTFGLWERAIETPNLILLNPLGYHAMLRLNMAARLMLTDSGGLQEECCVLGTPCITLRENTERPVTLREHGGLSLLTGNDLGRIRAAFSSFMALTAAQPDKQPHRPELWDGHAADRCVAAIVEASRS